MMTRTLLSLVATVALAACGSGDPAPAIPRRIAYPRPQLPDTVMQPVDSLPVSFLANAAAIVSRPAPGWLNIAYPSLGATIHVTFSPVDDSTIGEVRANRLERLLLNSGDRPSSRREYINQAGYDILTVVTEGSATPVQFLATDGSTIVVSGAAYFSDPRAATATDSMAPIIGAVVADIDRSLNTLGL